MKVVFHIFLVVALVGCGSESPAPPTATAALCTGPIIGEWVNAQASVGVIFNEYCDVGVVTSKSECVATGKYSGPTASNSGSLQVTLTASGPQGCPTDTRNLTGTYTVQGQVLTTVLSGVTETYVRYR